MKLSKLAIGALVSAVGAFGTVAHGAIVINEVYGGGGSTNASTSYKQDFVELYNTGSTAVNIGGYAIDYGSATGNFASSASGRYTIPADTFINPNDYFLVAFNQTGSNLAGATLVGDITVSSSLAMSGTNGKVRLVIASLITTNNKTVSGDGFLDLVGYGTADTFEGSAAAGVLSVSTSASRNATHDDTNQNSVDFTVGTPSPTTSSPIPEPAALGLFAPAAMILARRRKA